MSKSGSLSPDATLIGGLVGTKTYGPRGQASERVLRADDLCRACSHIATHHGPLGCKTATWPHGERCECPLTGVLSHGERFGGDSRLTPHTPPSRTVERLTEIRSEK